MNRLILAAAFLMLPAGAMAQAPIAADASDNPGAAVLAVAAPVVSADATDVARQSRPLLSQAPATATPPNRAAPRRRGSMVGYIDDAVVESKVRLRYDFGSDMNAPDRAEFFYAKCGCYRSGPDSIFKDPAAPGPFDGVVTSLDFRQGYAQGEVGLTDRFSLFADLPYRSIHPQTSRGPNGFPDSSGLSDIRGGFKFAVVANDRNVVTLQGRMSLPTGDPARGLGTNHKTIEPAVLFSSQVSDRLAVEGMVGDSHPLGGSAGVPTHDSAKFSGDVFFWGIGPSYEAYRSGNVSIAPVVELVGWRVLGGFQTVDPTVTPSVLVLKPCCAGVAADDKNIVNIKVGARTTWRGDNSVYVGYGKALTNARWYHDILRLEYRYAF